MNLLHLHIYIYGYGVLKMGGRQNHPSLVSLLSMRHPLVLGYQCNIVCYHIISTFVVLLCPTNIRLQYIYIYAVYILLYYIHIMCIYDIMVYMYVIYVYVYILYTIPIYIIWYVIFVYSCGMLLSPIGCLACSANSAVAATGCGSKGAAGGGLEDVSFLPKKLWNYIDSMNFLWISMNLSDFDGFC